MGKLKRKTLVEHPAETFAVGSFAGLTALLVAVGVDPDKAAAISGAVSAFVPMVTTFIVNLRADYEARKAEAEAILEAGKDVYDAGADVFDDSSS